MTQRDSVPDNMVPCHCGLCAQVISGVLTVVVIGGLGYYFLTKGDRSDDDSGSGGGSNRSKSNDDDLDDPLADVKRIMVSLKGRDIVV